MAMSRTDPCRWTDRAAAQGDRVSRLPGVGVAPGGLRGESVIRVSAGERTSNWSAVTVTKKNASWCGGSIAATDPSATRS